MPDRSRPLGLIVNPRAGSDVRRVLASASTTTLEEKISIVRRVVLGAAEAGVETVVVNHDPHQIVRRATETLTGPEIRVVRRDLAFDERDTIATAGIQRELGCGAVVTLGGDGTNRAALSGWPDMPLLPLSTGTNNAFPVFVEPTIAGTAAGLVVTGAVGVEDVSVRRPLARVRCGDRDEDVALVDVVVTSDRYVGSLELFDPRTLRLAVLVAPDPTAIGFASVAARLGCSGPTAVWFEPPDAASELVRVATAPGHCASLGIARVAPVAPGDAVEYHGDAVVAYDGERMRRVGTGETVSVRVDPDGPRVLEPARIMSRAAADGLFRRTGAARD